MPNSPFENTFNLPLDAEGFCVGEAGKVPAAYVGKRICGGRHSTGKPGPCLKSPQANHRCYKHGGPTPTGIAASNYQGKGYSKYLPKRLVDDFESSLADGALVELRRDIALVETQLNDALRRLSGTGAGMSAWQEACAALRSLLAALQQKPANEAEAADAARRQGEALLALQTLVEQGNREAGPWEEVGKLIDQKRRLVDSESRREANLQSSMSMERAILWYEYLVTAVVENVSNRSELARIQSQWNRLVGAASQPSVLASADPGDNADRA